jgi:hypothetical protein
MGGKRKPFITSKAVSEAVIRSGEACGWASTLTQEAWELASMHLTEEIVGTAFDAFLIKPGFSALFQRSVYMVTGSEELRFSCPSGCLSNPSYILSEKIRNLIKRDWPLMPLVGRPCEWHDFSASLLEVLMEAKVSSHRLKGKKLEEDLGM